METTAVRGTRNTPLATVKVRSATAAATAMALMCRSVVLVIGGVDSSATIAAGKV